MGKINDLIKEMCPNGIEYKKLNEIGNVFTGLSGKSKNDFIDGNARFITYTNIYNNPAVKLDLDDMVIIRDNENQNELKYGDILVAGSSENLEDSGMISVVCEELTENVYLNSFCFGFRLNDKYKDKLIPGFSKHIFRSASFRSQIVSCSFGVTRYNLNKKMFLDLTIPIPPIEVQEEIVRILDKFGELEAELEAELEVRKNQYEFWRAELFKSEKVKQYKLEELFNLKNGFTPSKSNESFWTDGTVPWFRMEDIRLNGRILNDAIQHVTIEATKGNIMPKNSIIVSTSATIGEHALLTCKSLSNQRFTYLVLKDQYKDIVDMKYIFYHCFLLDEYCMNNLNQGNFASIDMNAFKRYVFNIPSIDKQRKIVKVLDKFDALVNDITEGIPAEVKLRRQQYEYYRNKLLSFEELI